jgi:predicted anti-sigma-YlaC factor YlaD
MRIDRGGTMETKDRFGPVDGNCSRVRELLSIEPSGTLSGGELQEISEHLADCILCRDEAALLALLRRARPATPDVLLPLILRRVERASHHRNQRRIWGLRAAAAVVLALGVGTFWSSRGPDPAEEEVWDLALREGPVAASWSGGQYMAAGVPLLDQLPDEVLLALLEAEGGP